MRIVSSELLKGLYDQPRSLGYHVSGSIGRMLKAIDPKRYGDGDSRDLPLNYWSLGHAVEAALADAVNRKYPDRYIRIGEVEKDGITGSPDFLDVDPQKECPICEEYCPSVVDVKLTKISAKRLKEEDFTWMWKYWIQVKAYCSMLEVHRGGVLFVFINGDYRGIEPVVALIEDEWDLEELEENWNMIYNNRGNPE